MTWANIGRLVGVLVSVLETAAIIQRVLALSPFTN